MADPILNMPIGPVFSDGTDSEPDVITAIRTAQARGIVMLYAGSTIVATPSAVLHAYDELLQQLVAVRLTHRMVRLTAGARPTESLQDAITRLQDISNAAIEAYGAAIAADAGAVEPTPMRMVSMRARQHDKLTTLYQTIHHHLTTTGTPMTPPWSAMREASKT